MNSTPARDPWHHGDPYERYIGRWSRLVAPRFVEWLSLPTGLTWLDVGCGTGALCATILDHAAPTSVVGVEPSDGFRATAAANLAGRASFHAGSATAIPLDADSIDAVVSGLVLNFVAEPEAALREMSRVARSGGTIAAYVWDYADGMALLRIFWDAAAALDPRAAELDEGVRFPLCHRPSLERLFSAAGLLDVTSASIEVPTRFESFHDYWEPFLGGQGPAPGYVSSLEDSRQTALRELLRTRLETAADGSISLNARAWAVRGRVAA